MTGNGITELRAALVKAKADLEEAVRALASRRVGGEMEAYDAAFETLMTAERKLAHAEDRPYAVCCDCPLSWDTGAPLPTLLQSDQTAFLFFVLPDDDEHIGQIQFEGLSSTSFGAPNDECFEGHPLHGSGFEPYRAMSVVNSAWIAQLEKTNGVHPRHDPSIYASQKHFIFPFHDTTFECVARAFTTSKVSGRLSETVGNAVGLLY